MRRTDVAQGDTEGTKGDPRPRLRWMILAIVSVGQLVIALDATVVSVMGPVLQEDLGLDATGLQWVFNNYIIIFGGLLLLGGRLNDVVGRRVMFLLGLAVFGAASLWAGLADSEGHLLAARALQGLGAAALSPACLAILVVSFPNPAERTKAFGIWGMVLGMGAGLGTLVGGAVVEIDWRLAFYINIPIAILLAVAALALIPADHKTGPRPRADILGGLTGTLGLGSLVYGIVSIQGNGWSDTTTLLTLAAALVLLATFVSVEYRVAEPLLPLRLFTRRTVIAGSLGEFFTAGVMMPMFMLLPIYMQGVLGYSALATGLAYIPTTLAMMIVAGPLSKAITTIGPRLPYLAGVVVLLVTVVLVARTPLSGSYWTIMMPITALLGVGLVLCLIPTPSVGTANATAIDAGATSSVLNVATQVGGALGLAISATIFQSRMTELMTAGIPVREALNESLHLSLIPMFVWLVLSFLNGLISFRGIRLTEADLVPAEARTDDGEGEFVDSSPASPPQGSMK